jgi:hypothetical protein
MAAAQMATIRLNITAYSIAVGPSSLRANARIDAQSRNMPKRYGALTWCQTATSADLSSARPFVSARTLALMAPGSRSLQFLARYFGFVASVAT